MTTFDDLLQAYRSSPEKAFDLIDSLEAQERKDLLLENVEGRLASRRIEDEDSHAELPRAYRKLGGVRWDYFGYILHYYERPMLERHLDFSYLLTEEQKPGANKGSTYLRNMLALLVWMSVREDADEGPEAAKKRGRRG